MPKVSYLNLDGEVLSESREGVRRDYVPDPLGSVAAELDSSGAKAAEFDYWPYGEERTMSGSSSSPHRFVGTLGYYTDVPSKKVYVRARDYLPREGRWLTVDPLWPDESKYVYAEDNPVSWVDPSGQSSGQLVEVPVDLLEGRPKSAPGKTPPASVPVQPRLPWWYKPCLIASLSLIPSNLSADSSIGMNPGWGNQSLSKRGTRKLRCDQIKELLKNSCRGLSSNRKNHICSDKMGCDEFERNSRRMVRCERLRNLYTRYCLKRASDYGHEWQEIRANEEANLCYELAMRRGCPDWRWSQ